MKFDEFAKEVRWILRFQDGERVELFISVSERALGFVEWNEDRLDSLGQDYYKEAIHGGASKEAAARSSLEVMVSQIIDFPPTNYKKSTDPEIKEKKRALEYLYSLQNMLKRESVEELCIDINSVQQSIKNIEESLKANEVLNTGGKPSSLNDQELVRLVNLKALYAVSFPENSHRYTPGNILHQLAECLIGRTISRKCDAMVDKAIIHLRSLDD